MDKPRVHYGGNSCYSCRQFFRRLTISGVSKSCALRGRCAETPGTIRNCKACRFKQCLEIGMRQDLVLGKQNENKRETVEIVDESSASSNVSNTSDDGFEFPKESDTTDYSVHESTLDPVTGINSDTLNNKDLPENSSNEVESDLEHIFNPVAGLSDKMDYLQKKYRSKLMDEVSTATENVIIESVVVNPVVDQPGSEVTVRKVSTQQNR